MSRALPPLRRVVIKVGSALLAPGGRVDERTFDALARQIARARDAGPSVALVSSGAVASGFRALGLEKPPGSIVQKQAAAAVGQPRLMATWAHAFQHAGVTVGQVLLTAEDLDDRPRYLHARRTLGELLDRGVLPVINENDTTSFAEIKLGDNDRLSALAAGLIDADLLLLLSTVRGLYRGSRGEDVIERVAPDGLAHALDHVRREKSGVGTGGFATKLDAALVAASWGIPTIVAGGHEPDIVARALAGEPVGTLFEARPARTGSRKRWLASSARGRGRLVVDDGARRALMRRNASLLPSGVTGVEGAFARGSPVDIAGPDGEVFARGIALYDAPEIARLRGLASARIAPTLGYVYAQEVVHRNDLVILPHAARP